MVVFRKGALRRLFEEVGEIAVIVAGKLRDVFETAQRVDVRVDVVHQLIAEHFLLRYVVRMLDVRRQFFEIADQIHDDLPQRRGDELFGVFAAVAEFVDDVGYEIAYDLIGHDALVRRHEPLDDGFKLGAIGLDLRVEGDEVVFQRVGARGYLVQVAGEGEIDVALLYRHGLAVGVDRTFAARDDGQLEQVDVRVRRHHRRGAAIQPAYLIQVDAEEGERLREIVVADVEIRRLPPFRARGRLPADVEIYPVHVIVLLILSILQWGAKFVNTPRKKSFRGVTGHIFKNFISKE